ncbi:hypothetical protein OG607_07825 [Streptomyces sp. NBC_01537]|uniref:hypothetical protein n=1 Tax=Streptomyces sp. NBC_01537 TaxID=2903896 RepID=UPI00386A5222
MGSQPLPTLPEHPHNTALLAHLRARAAPPHGPHDMALGAWQLHTHPDLWERLHKLALWQPLSAAYGVPVLAYEGVAAAVAEGMSDLLVRLPSPPTNLKAGEPVPPLIDDGWHAVDAWQSDLHSIEGDYRLCELIEAALVHTRELIAQGP